MGSAAANVTSMTDYLAATLAEADELETHIHRFRTSIASRLRTMQIAESKLVADAVADHLDRVERNVGYPDAISVDELLVEARSR